MATGGQNMVPPEGYTEDEMGLFVDPDADGPHSFEPPAPPTEPEPQPSLEDELRIERRFRRKSIVLRIVVFALIAIILVVGIFGMMVFSSVQRIKGATDDAEMQATTLKDAFLEGNQDSLRASAEAIRSDVMVISDEVNSPLWTRLQGLPMVSTDVSNVKTLVGCVSDLTDHALMPLVDGLAGVRFADLMQEGRINTDLVRRMRDSVVAASPVIVANANTMASLPAGSVARVNDVVAKLRDPLNQASAYLGDANGLFTLILGMLGDGGQTRHYVLLAQTNSEIRSSGGFPGSVGVLRITDGNIELEDFTTIYHLKEASHDKGVRANVSDEEYAAFLEGYASDAASPTLTPNYPRVGEVLRDFWVGSYGGQVDGVFGLDPIFLQRMLALTGGVVASDGTEVNGENAAFELLSNVYWRYGYDYGDAGNEEEDAFFSDVANRAADKVISSLGSVDFEAFLDVVTRSGSDRHLQMWMANPDEENFMKRLGISGALQEDIARPEIGIFANDNTWSKISWYLNIWADVDAGTRNEDGTTTYRVTAHYFNNITDDVIWSAPIYVYGNNPQKQERGDMVDTLYIMAPLGGIITDFEVHASRYPEGGYPTAFVPCYGREMWRAQVLIGSQEDVTVTFAVTLPSEVTEPPAIRTSPLCHD